MRWLCSIKLNWFVLSSERKSSEGKSCTNETVNGTDGAVYTRILPCVGVCHEVLRRCPYYLPSEQQFNDDPKVLIYGGYPAFDCPQEDSIASCKNSYSPSNFECFGNGSSPSTTINCILLLFVSLFVLSLVIY